MGQDDQPAGKNKGDARRGDAAEPELPEVAMDSLVEQPEGGYRSEREPPGDRDRVLGFLDAGTVVMQFDNKYRLVAEDNEERVELLGVDIEQRVISRGLCQTYSRIRGNRWMCTRYRVEAHYELILTSWRPPDEMLRWSPEPRPDPVLRYPRRRSRECGLRSGDLTPCSLIGWTGRRDPRRCLPRTP